MKVDRLVLDSNVLISAILSPRGAPARLLGELSRTRAVLLFSDPAMTELADRLMRDKFEAYVDRQSRLRILAELDAVSEFVGIAGAPMGCRDRDDDKFLETALAGNADMLVSGDRDLLDLHPWQQIPILNPSQALEKMSAEAR